MFWEITLVLAVLAIGVAIGMLIGRKYYISESSQGILNVDCSNAANGPYLYLDLNVPIAEVVDQKQVLFEVRVL